MTALQAFQDVTIRISYFRVDIKEDVVFKAKQQPVIFPNALLHKRTGWVQPPANHSNNWSDEL